MYAGIGDLLECALVLLVPQQGLTGLGPFKDAERVLAHIVRPEFGDDIERAETPPHHQPPVVKTDGEHA